MLSKKERKNKVVKIAAFLAIAGVSYIFVVLYVGPLIPCPIHLLTGWECPGCGVSRMFFAMLRLDFVSAFHYNAMTFCALPFIVFILLYMGFRYVEYGDQKMPRIIEGAVVLLIIGYIIFGIGRNLI